MCNPVNSSLTLHQVDHCKVNWLTLSSHIFIVQVVEVSTLTLVEDIVVTNSQVSFLGDRPTSSVDRTGLRWWAIELELSVGDNGANSSLAVGQETTLQGHGQGILRDTRLRVGAGVSFSDTRCADLTIRNLFSAGSGGLVLDLSVTDASSNSSSSAVLDLSVANLADWSSGSGGAVLDLSVTNLLHWSSSSSSLMADLTVANLLHWSSSSSGAVADAAITDAAHWSSSSLGGAVLNATIIYLLHWGSSLRSAVLDATIVYLLNCCSSLGGLMADLTIADAVNSPLGLGSGSGSRVGNGVDLDTELLSVIRGSTRRSRAGRCQSRVVVARHVSSEGLGHKKSNS